MPRPRTLEERKIDTLDAYNTFRDALTPDPMRGMLNQMTSLPQEGTDVGAYASLVQSSIHLARIVAANDRAAMIAAAMVTQNGVSRPIINDDAGGDA